MKIDKGDERLEMESKMDEGDHSAEENNEKKKHSE